jgi:gliding motility-associated-like protein
VLSKNWLYKNNSSIKNKTPNFFIWCFVLFCFVSKSQVNLVSNPSFETYSSCPTSQSQIKFATGWDTLKAGGGGTPDYFNACDMSTAFSVPYNLFSFQYAKTGQGYGMIVLYYTQFQDSREYIQTKLLQKLSPNKTYCVSAYVNLNNFSNLAIDQIGLYFDDGTVNSMPGTVTNPVIPQILSPMGLFITDTLNWTKIQNTFIANGTEEYLTIGNFKTDALTNSDTLQTGIGYYALYYIDNISVIEINSKANAGVDKTICAGDSAFIGTNEEVLDCQWFSNNIQIAQGAGIWVKPTTNQQYVIKQDICGTLSYDTVQVSIKVINCNPVVNSEIPNTFTPNGDGVNDTWHFNLGSDVIINEFEVYNRWGNLIKKLEIDNSNYILWDGYTTSGESCSDGIYFYVLKYTDAKDEVQNKKGFISLFR